MGQYCNVLDLINIPKLGDTGILKFQYCPIGGETRGGRGGRVAHPWKVWGKLWKEGGKEEKREREKEEEREKRGKEKRGNGEENKQGKL